MRQIKDSILMDDILRYLDSKKFYVPIDTLAGNLGVAPEKLHALALKMESKKHLRIQMYDGWNLIILPQGIQFLRNGGYAVREKESWILSLSKSRWFLAPASFLMGVFVTSLYLGADYPKARPEKNVYRNTSDSLPHKPDEQPRNI
jgi:hypothetical protein